MADDPVLRLLGLARKAGRLEVGEEPAGAACRSRQAKLLLLAADAAPNTRRRAAHFGQAGNVLWVEIPFDKSRLGLVLGRSSCAMAALTDAGLAAAVLEKLAARDPQAYGPAARQLREKADRVLQRQREQRRHEKNLRQGKRAPWAPPPGAQKAKAGPVRGKDAPSGAGPPRPGRQAAKTPARSGPGRRRLTGTFRKP